MNLYYLFDITLLGSFNHVVCSLHPDLFKTEGEKGAISFISSLTLDYQIFLKTQFLKVEIELNTY